MSILFTIKKSYFGFLLIFLIYTISCSSDNTDNGDIIDPPKKDTTWVLDKTMSDEFDIWDAEKWNTSLWYSTTKEFAFKPSNASVSDGYLKLTARKESYNGKSYTCAAVKSNFQIGENTLIEIKAKTIDYRANVTTALWLSDIPLATSNPNVEIDLMETMQASAQPQRFTATIHHWLIGGTNSGDNPRGWIVMDLTSGNLSDNFHIYKLERRNGYIRLTFDNKVYWEFDTSDYPNISTQERNVIFSIEGHAGTPVDAYLPGEFLIDYIRTYRTTTTPAIAKEGGNLVVNSGFEASSGSNIDKWTTIGNQNSVVHVEAGGAYSGSNKLVFSSANSFSTSISQKITNLPTGIYRMEAMAYKSGNAFSSCKIYAKGFDGEERFGFLEINSSEWQKVIINNIYIHNGECEIGISATSAGDINSKAYFDDVKLYKVTY